MKRRPQPTVISRDPVLSQSIAIAIHRRRVKEARRARRPGFITRLRILLNLEP